MSTKIIDWLYGVIARPAITLREIAREKPAGWAFLIYIGVVCLTSVISIYGGGISESLEEVMAPIGFRLPTGVFLGGAIIMAIISIFISTLVLHLLARLLGGKGGYWNFFSAYAFTSFPGIINVPAVLLLGFMGAFGNIISGIISFGISIWVLVLQVLAVRESHGLSTGKSILTYIIYVFILVAIPAAIIAGLIMMVGISL